MKHKVTHVLGIDEAGRGAALGPMILAGVAIERSKIDELISLGVADSKTYGGGAVARNIRLRLAARIKPLCEISVHSVSATRIDFLRTRHRTSLNEIERNMAEAIMEDLNATDNSTFEIIADGRSLFKDLEPVHENFKSHDKAESKFPHVAAASIIAKVMRDQKMEEIYQKYGTSLDEIGGAGYPNPNTEVFLRKYVKKYKGLPPEARRSWSWLSKRFFRYID